jgi:hypothetical protein
MIREMHLVLRPISKVICLQPAQYGPHGPGVNGTTITCWYWTVSQLFPVDQGYTEPPVVVITGDALVPAQATALINSTGTGGISNSDQCRIWIQSNTCCDI